MCSHSCDEAKGNLKPAVKEINVVKGQEGIAVQGSSYSMIAINSEIIRSDDRHSIRHLSKWASKLRPNDSFCKGVKLVICRKSWVATQIIREYYLDISV